MPQGAANVVHRAFVAPVATLAAEVFSPAACSDRTTPKSLDSAGNQELVEPWMENDIAIGTQSCSCAETGRK
jgi:hypothetical protein